MEEVKDPEAVLAELRRAQEDLKTLRAKVTAVETERDSLKEQMDSLDPDKWKSNALDAQVRLALLNQGIKDADRLMPYIGTEGLDLDETGKVTGLDERLGNLKKDLPEVFDPKVRAGGKADIFASNPANEKIDPFEAQVKRALGHAS